MQHTQPASQAPPPAAHSLGAQHESQLVDLTQGGHHQSGVPHLPGVERVRGAAAGGARRRRRGGCRAGCVGRQQVVSGEVAERAAPGRVGGERLVCPTAAAAPRQAALRPRRPAAAASASAPRAPSSPPLPAHARSPVLQRAHKVGKVWREPVSRQLLGWWRGGAAARPRAHFIVQVDGCQLGARVLRRRLCRLLRAAQEQGWVAG